MNISNNEKAKILTEALPYIQKYHGQIIVVKYGGNAMINPEMVEDVMRDIVLLNQIGIKIVLVHGGGPEINDTLAKMNIKTKFVNGLRQTDKETVDVVQMVLAGKVNKNLVNIIENLGGKAVGLCGIDGHMIEAKKLNDDLGYVGEITDVNPKIILDALSLGYIPIISSIGCDKENNVYNINADNVASHVAGAIKAVSLVSMSVNGILADINDESSLIRSINASEANHLISEKVIDGGMIPKVHSCIEAIRMGVKRVFIINGTVPHAILIEVLSDEGIGTMFY